MNQTIKEGKHEILQFDTTPGVGIFAQIGLPLDTMAKVVAFE
jgi:hypothetical protein